MPSEFDISQAAARIYAESLLELATAAGQADAVQAELDDLQALWDRDSNFRALMRSAAIDQDARRDSLRKVFGGRLSTLTLNLLLVLNVRWRTSVLPEVCRAYRQRLDRRHQREQVFVVSAAPLEEPHRAAVRTQIKRLTGNEAVLNERVDPNVLGGLRVQVGDRVYDATLSRRLADLRRVLLQSVEKHLLKQAPRFLTEG